VRVADFDHFLCRLFFDVAALIITMSVMSGFRRRTLLIPASAASRMSTG